MIPTCRLAHTAVVTWLGLVGFLGAQTLDESLERVAWSFGSDGALQIAPDPAFGSDDGPPGRVVDFQAGYVFPNLGVLGYASILLQGGSDFAGLIDAAGLADKLGVDEQELISRLSDPPQAEADRTAQLRYRIWLHAAEQLRLAPAVGPLEKVAETPGVSLSLQSAARRAVARIRGEAAARQAPALVPLVTALSRVPAGAFATVVSENHRMPPPRALMELAERSGMVVTRQEVALAGGTVSAAMAAGASRMTALPGVLGYEIARQFGNHRIDRALLAVFVDPRRLEPRVWVSFEGRFELDALRAGLQGLEIPHTVDQEPGRPAELSLEPVPGLRVEVRPDRAVLAMAGIDAAPLGPDGAAELLEEFEGFEDLPVRVRIGELPEELAKQAMVMGALPEVVGLRPAYGEDELWVLRSRYPNENLATALEQQLSGIPRMLEVEAEELDFPASSFEFIERIETARDGRVVTFRYPGRMPTDEELRALLDALR